MNTRITAMQTQPSPNSRLLLGILLLTPAWAYAADSAGEKATIEYILANLINFVTMLPSVFHRVFYLVGIFYMFQALIRMSNYKKDNNVHLSSEYIRFIGGLALFCLIAFIDYSGSLTMWGEGSGKKSQMQEMMEKTQKPADGRTLQGCLGGGNGTCSDY